jgi:hypothetical protein
MGALGPYELNTFCSFSYSYFINIIITILLNFPL